MEDIKRISYKYNKDLKNPITYYIQTKTITTSLNYKDALEIAYAVIDSLGGSYDYLDNLVWDYEEKDNCDLVDEEEESRKRKQEYDQTIADEIAWQNMRL